MFASFDATRAPALGLSLPEGNGTELLRLQRDTGYFARERSLVRPVELRRHSPMASGGPAISRFDDAPRAGAFSRGAVRHRRHRRSIPLCATFPTSQGDKFTDAVRPPQLPLLRDSKSFVKGISPVAPSGQNSGSIRGAALAIGCPQAVPWLNAAYPQGAGVLHRPKEAN
jgi:hypothetical protein